MGSTTWQRWSPGINTYGWSSTSMIDVTDSVGLDSWYRSTTTVRSAKPYDRSFCLVSFEPSTVCHLPFTFLPSHSLSPVPGVRTIFVFMISLPTLSYRSCAFQVHSHTKLKTNVWPSTLDRYAEKVGYILGENRGQKSILRSVALHANFAPQSWKLYDTQAASRCVFVRN